MNLPEHNTELLPIPKVVSICRVCDPVGHTLLEFHYVGYSTASYTDITLFLGESFNLNAQIKQSAIEVVEVTIIGSKPSKFSTTKTGATTNISNEQIDVDAYD